MTRKPHAEAARDLKNRGIEVIEGDLDDEDSLKRALDGVWGVYAVQNTWEAGVENEETQGHRLARLAKTAGVEHYVYASVGSAHRKTGIPHFDNKARVEATVQSLGFPTTVVIRPSTAKTFDRFLIFCCFSFLDVTRMSHMRAGFSQPPHWTGHTCGAERDRHCEPKFPTQ